MTAQYWDNIPDELKWARQWLLGGPNDKGEMKVPHTINAQGRPVLASSTDKSLWIDFETACEFAESLGWSIGYVCSAEDQLACIDLDVKNQINLPVETANAKWTTPEQFARFQKIIDVFDSYTELSNSGQGVHVWVRGKIGKGCNHDKVEVYSQERFIVCTGRVVIDKPISERQEMLDVLVAEIRLRQGSGKGEGLALVELEEEYTDDEIIERAIGAGNADKFSALCNCTSTDPSTGELGSFTALGYKSQSEADLALLSMFTFYSKSNAQCRRLFRMSGLGRREKATKNDRYLDDTLKLIRGRQAREAVMDDHAKALAKSLVMELQADALAKSEAQPTPQQGAAPAQGQQAPLAGAVADTSLPWPPGLTGAVAWHIFKSSPRPVKEVAIVAALGLMAGICGKVYQIPQSGLNLYIILVARSAIGKEAMHSGISSILSELRESVPSAQRFVDFADFASGPALQKACAVNSSFVNVSGEWGRKLKRLSGEDGKDVAMQSLRTVMTNLYQKSGKTSTVGGLTYSNKEQNVASVNGVSYSMIGETTPGTFYDSLTEAMMEDGFLSRFTVIEYNGSRPPMNDARVERMEEGLAAALHSLVVQVITMMDRTQVIDVVFEPQAMSLVHQFNAQCDGQINSTTDEAWRQMWNRAHLKVLRIASLLAVADNHLAPVVFAQHVEWALDLVQRDIKMFQRRIEAGDVGTGDNARESKLLACMREYIRDGAGEGYALPQAMVKAGIVARKYLQQRCARQTAFSAHRLGAVNALDSALRSMVDCGYIVEVDKGKLVAEYGFHGKAYRVLNLSA